MIPRRILSRSLLATAHTTAPKPFIPVPTARPLPRRPIATPPHRSASHLPHQTIRWLSSKSTADEAIEEITELYATAQDEFEIAMEETEKVSVYAEEDRKAAREELDRVRAAYDKVVAGPDAALAEEVKRRVGQRIRELEQGVKAMEEMALNQD